MALIRDCTREARLALNLNSILNTWTYQWRIACAIASFAGCQTASYCARGFLFSIFRRYRSFPCNSQAFSYRSGWSRCMLRSETHVREIRSQLCFCNCIRSLITTSPRRDPNDLLARPIVGLLAQRTKHERGLHVLAILQTVIPLVFAAYQ